MKDERCDPAALPYVANNPVESVDAAGTTLLSTTGRNTILDIAGNAAPHVGFRADGSVDTTALTANDLQDNEGALLLQEMAASSHVFTYEEGTTAVSRGGTNTVDGVLNLDNHPTDMILPNGQPLSKPATRYPVAGVDGAVTVNPAAHYVDAATHTLSVPTRAIAFHELAESYTKIEHNMLRGPNDGPGAHFAARLREVILMMQRPAWTSYPAGGEVSR